MARRSMSSLGDQSYSTALQHQASKSWDLSQDGPVPRFKSNMQNRIETGNWFPKFQGFVLFLASQKSGTQKIPPR